MKKTIEIPEGYEARIEDNKVILEPKESEDERIRKGLIAYFDDFTLPTFGGLNPQKIRVWLEKQSKEEINEASYRTGVKRVLDNPESYGLEKQGSQNLANSAKTCKDEQNSAWSEEDEKMYNVVHDLAWESYKTSRRLDIPTFGIINDWLKSLKERYTWKPSDEQLEALEHSLGDYNIAVFVDRHKILTSLYQDIKKLKG